VAIFAKGKLVAEGRIDVLLAGQEKLRLLTTTRDILMTSLGDRGEPDGEGTLVSISRAHAPDLLHELVGRGVRLVEARWVGGDLEKFYLDQTENTHDK
jgi:hypothetical protein